MKKRILTSYHQKPLGWRFPLDITKEANTYLSTIQIYNGLRLMNAKNFIDMVKLQFSRKTLFIIITDGTDEEVAMKAIIDMLL